MTCFATSTHVVEKVVDEEWLRAAITARAVNSASKLLTRNTYDLLASVFTHASDWRLPYASSHMAANSSSKYGTLLVSAS